LRALLLVPLFILHCPAIYIFFLKARWCLGALSLLLLWGFLFLWAALNERPRRLGFRALYGFYLLGLSVGTSVPAYFAFVIGGWARFFLALAVAIALFVAGRLKKVRVPLVLFALVIVYLLLSDVHLPVALCLCFVFGLALAAGILARAGAVALAFAGLGASLFSVVLNFWVGVPMEKLDLVRAQGDVELLLDYSELADDAILSNIPYRSDLKFVAESCEPDVYLIGVRRKVSGLLRISAGDPADRRLFELSEEIADNAVVDCERGLLYFGAKRSGVLYVLDEGTLAERERVELGRPRFGAVYLGKRRLYVLYDQTPAWAALDRSDFVNVKWLTARGFNNGLSIDQADERIYHLSSEGVVSVWDAEGLTLKSSATVEGRVLAFLNMAFARDRGELYILSMESGSVLVLDADSLEVVRSAKLPRGVRFSRYNPTNGKLYIANYFEGELYEVSPSRLVILRRWYLGPRLRWLEITRDGGAVLAASSLGAFRIELGDGGG